MSKKIKVMRARKATFHQVWRVLTLLQGRVAPHELAVARMAFSMIAWETFPAPSCGLPGADIGQSADARFALTGGRSLHLQRFMRPSGEVVEAHLDEHDACTAPIEHAAHATRAIEYGVSAGLGISLIAYVLTGSRKAALTAGSLALGGGIFVGAHTPTQDRRVFDFTTMNPSRQA